MEQADYVVEPRDVGPSETVETVVAATKSAEVADDAGEAHIGSSLEEMTNPDGLRSAEHRAVRLRRKAGRREDRRRPAGMLQRREDDQGAARGQSASKAWNAGRRRPCNLKGAAR